MDRSRRVAFAATLGNLLQGWDNGAIAGALLYLKPELGLQNNPILEGIIVGSTLVGALVSTVCSGPGSDWLGRRLILCISAILYTVSSGIMLWSPSIPVLILARLLVGAGVGIAVTIVPIYIAETAPAEIRGELSTLPQFMGSGGLVLSYIFCFIFSLTSTPNWRIMLALLLVPSALYLAFVLFYLPESPRWLVSKGKMVEAKTILQKLRMKKDVSAELALLVEGLGISSGASLEEWFIEPAVTADGVKTETEERIMWTARLNAGHTDQHQSSFMDPMVSVIGSLNKSEAFDGAFGGGGGGGGIDYDGDLDIENGDLLDEHMKTPLLSRHASSTVVNSEFSTSLPSVSIGGGWQLAWQLEKEEQPAPTLRRVFLLQDGASVASSSAMSMPPCPDGDNTPQVEHPVPAAALISQPTQSFVAAQDNNEVAGPAMIHPSEMALKGPAWADLLEVGVRRALLVGVVLQILQQFSGINAVLYFVPQILEQSGANNLLASLGLSSASASILGGGFTCLIMLPCIFLAMKLMDHTGRRQILLTTLPVLFLSLILMVAASTWVPKGIFQAATSFLGVTVYVCVFVMGFGPIPNILGSEIFPTRVRGLCIGICQASMWCCNILLTNMFPTLLTCLGIGGLFGCFAGVVLLAFIFTWLKVPETKGMPLEVISDFFAMKHQQ